MPRNPTPIATTINAGAFGSKTYASRLFIGGVQKPFLSAEILSPRKSLGKSLQINLARADLAELPEGATFKFEIGVNVSGVWVWTEILDGATLLGKNYSISLERDSLSFSTVEPLSDKLAKSPKNNLIVFDGNRQTVNVDEIEKLYTNTNEFITTSSRDLRPLTLYKLLDIAFVEGCGFASVRTNVPNSPAVRCDFTTSQTYETAVSHFLGIWEPEIFETNGVLNIITPFADLPAGFIAETLPNARISGFSQNSQYSSANIDGYNLLYMTDGGSFYVDRELDPVPDKSGEYGSPGYIETLATRTVREWKASNDSTEVFRTETKKEVRETREDSVLTGRETVEYTFDKFGRTTGYTKTLEARMPDIDNSNLPSLLQTQSETQIVTYKTNPFASRQIYQSRVETRISALLAVDAENTALDKNGDDAPFKQSYEKVFEAGNLKSGMTSEFSVIETQVMQFIPKRNGQVEVREERYDVLRGKPRPPRNEPRSGDISVSNYSKQRSYAVFKEGVTQATRTGRPLPDFNVGEVPFFFAEPLTKRKLAQELTGVQVEVPGFDESVERGVIFALPGRGGVVLGNFLTSGFRVNILPASIKTTIDAIKLS